LNETIIFLIRHPNAVRQVLKHLVRIPLSDIRVKPVQIGSLYLKWRIKQTGSDPPTRQKLRVHIKILLFTNVLFRHIAPLHLPCSTTFFKVMV